LRRTFNDLSLGRLPPCAADALFVASPRGRTLTLTQNITGHFPKVRYPHGIGVEKPEYSRGRGGGRRQCVL